MLQTKSLQVRIAVMLIIIFFVSLPLVGAAAFFVLQKNIDEDVFQQASFFLNTMESVRKHVGKVMRPAAQEGLPGKFDVRLMSTSYAARGVAEKLKENFGEYSFRHTSANPRNPVNRADVFELGLIRDFATDRSMRETKGFIRRGNDEYFYVAKPVVSDVSCAGCHSTPDIAPKEVVATYGRTAAFNWQPDQVVASLIVYVPTKLARTHAFKALLTFMGLYAVVFLIILVLIDRVIVNSIIKPIGEFAATAEQISKGNLREEFPEANNREMTTLHDAFTRMKMSIIASMNMIEKYRNRGH
jgi:methyl-accepting chemotaxis protein